MTSSRACDVKDYAKRKAPVDIHEVSFRGCNELKGDEKKNEVMSS